MSTFFAIAIGVTIVAVAKVVAVDCAFAGLAKAITTITATKKIFSSLNKKEATLLGTASYLIQLVEFN